MATRENLLYLLATAALLLCGGAYLIVQNAGRSFDAQIPATPSEVHVHADLILAIDGQRVDLSKDVYQSTTENILHPDIHLHDNEGDVMHRHAQEVTLGEFLDSIGIWHEDGCLALKETEAPCSDTSNVFKLYVNGSLATDSLEYVIEDEDRLLVYHGPDDQSIIAPLLEAVSDRACIYSGTCPERGSPPQESCGLTCDI